MKILVTALALTTFFSQTACDKNSPAVVSNSFSWKYDNINYTARLDSAYTSSIPFSPLILASVNNSLFIPSAEVQIGLTSFALGNYSFTTGGANRMNFTDPVGNSYASIGGSLTISSSSSSAIWGNFDIQLNSGKNISGNFLNTPVRP